MDSEAIQQATEALSKKLSASPESSGPRCVVWASFQNLETIAELAGSAVGEDLRATALRELSRLGPTVVVGDELGTIVGGEVGSVIDQLKPASWLAHAFVGVTEAWRLKTTGATGATGAPTGEWLEGTVPSQLVELSAGLRFGVLALDSSQQKDLHAALEEAARMAREQKLEPRGVTRFGFPPLWPGGFRTLTQVSDPLCPSCAAISPTVLQQHATHSLERCQKCSLEYERHQLRLIGGRRVGECVRDG